MLHCFRIFPEKAGDLCLEHLKRAVSQVANQHRPPGLFEVDDRWEQPLDAPQEGLQVTSPPVTVFRGPVHAAADTIRDLFQLKDRIALCVFPDISNAPEER